MITGIAALLAPVWALVAPWLGPVGAVLFPWFARLKAKTEGAGGLLGSFAGVALLAGAVFLVVWVVHERREDLREQGEARCQKVTLTASVTALTAETQRRQEAESAANAARELIRQGEEKAALLEEELRKAREAKPATAAKATCYPKDIAKRLNKL